MMRLPRGTRCTVAMLGTSLLIAPLLLSACATPTVLGPTLVTDALPRKGDATAEASAELAQAINDFGVALLTTTPSKPGENTVISPVSVHAALSMAANGATDETEEQMRAVLATDALGDRETNEQWAALLRRLNRPTSPQTLDVANALWGQKGVPFEQSFVDTDRDYFGAGFYTLDFTEDNVAGAVNEWVENQTRGMITKMVSNVHPDAVLYLANAVYFKGEWVEPFSEEATERSSFTRSDGSTVKVDMMSTAHQMHYAENGTLQATRLHYAGNETAFYVLLPKAGVSLDSATSSLGGRGFSALRESMAEQGRTEVVLQMPKLDTDFRKSIEEPLTRMGMTNAFDRDTAQFSGIANIAAPLCIGGVLHASKVIVDETGTEAAAATVIGYEAGALAKAPTEPKRIVCDRPYLFAIVDEASGAMLFLGAVNDPNE